MKEQIEKQLKQFETQIINLPPSEIKYYLWLLAATFRKNNSVKVLELIKQTSLFIQSCQTYLLNKSEQNQLANIYNQLAKMSKTGRCETQYTHYLLPPQSLFLAISFGIIASLIASLAGAGRAVYHRENLPRYIIIAMITGFCLGAAIGYRLPDKVYKDKMLRQLAFALDGAKEAIYHTTLIRKSFFNCWQEEKQRLISEFFENNMDRFNQFCAQTTSYDIATFPAEFFSPSLKGYLGHHAFIKLEITNKKFTLEFTNTPSDIHAEPAQLERRFVKGAKILEMMALHRYLNQFHDVNNHRYLLTKMKSGERDCFSYVNMILLGSNQPATSLKRFKDEVWVSRYTVSFFIPKLAPFSQKALSFTRTSPQLTAVADQILEDSLSLNTELLIEEKQKEYIYYFLNQLKTITTDSKLLIAARAHFQEKNTADRCHGISLGLAGIEQSQATLFTSAVAEALYLTNDYYFNENPHEDFIKQCHQYDRYIQQDLIPKFVKTLNPEQLFVNLPDKINQEMVKYQVVKTVNNDYSFFKISAGVAAAAVTLMAAGKVLQ